MGETGVAVRDLRFSLVLMTLVIAIALTGLALEGNGPKVLRVALAFFVYTITLLALQSARSDSAAARRRLPFGWFLIAGLAAGIVSGVVRPLFRLDVLILGTFGSAVLLSGLHWIAVNYWRHFLPHRGR